MATQPYHLRCLGAPELARPDGTPIQFRTRKHFALLLFLAHERPIPHRRERLAAFLWPRTGALEARHSLATALSELRGRLGRELFAVTRDTIQLAPGTIATDVAALRDGTLSPEALAASGLFLEEFDVADAEDFQLWRDGCRMALVPLQCRLAMEQLDALRRQGRLDAMERWALFLWRLDPLSEDAVRAVIEARALSGDRVGALRYYTRWRERLAQELAALPSRQTEQLAERLRRGLLVKEQLDAPTQPAIAPADDRALLGRDGVLAACDAAWRDALRGAPHFLSLHGSRGAGRSALLATLGDYHALQGAAVVHVALRADGAVRPYDGLAVIAGRLLDLPGAGTVAPDRLAALVDLVPSLISRYAGLPPAPPREPHRLREALAALIAAVADERPLVILLDDLDATDGASAVALATLRLETPTRCLVLATSRLPQSDEALALPPLGRAVGAELLARWWRRDPPPPCHVDAMLDRAEGLPATLRHFADEWNTTGAAPSALLGLSLHHDESTIAAALALMPAAPLEAIDEHARMIGLVAAMHGPAVDVDRCSALTGLPLTIVVRTLSRLVMAGILDAPPSGHRFVSPMARAWCYFSAAPTLRARIHVAMLRDAETLPALTLAWHAMHAGAPQEALHWLESALRRAQGEGTTAALRVAVHTLLRRGDVVGAERLLELWREMERGREAA